MEKGKEFGAWGKEGWYKDEIKEMALIGKKWQGARDWSS